MPANRNRIIKHYESQAWPSKAAFLRSCGCTRYAFEQACKSAGIEPMWHKEPRTTSLAISVSESEKNEIESSAGSQELSVSEFLRRKVFAD